MKSILLFAIMMFITAVMFAQTGSNISASAGLTAAQTGPLLEYNPVNEELIVTMASSGNREEAEVFVIQNGVVVVKEMYLISVRQNEYVLNLSGIASGIYLVKIVAPSIRFSTKFKKV